MPDKESWGGPIYCEPPLVDALRSAGVEADEEIYVYGDKASATGVFQRMLRVIASARSLRRRTREKAYDLIHLNTSFDEKCVMRDLVTLAFLRSSGVPVYLKMHGSIAAFLNSKSRFWRFLQHQVFERAAGIGVLSSEERENFVRDGCPPEKLSNAKIVIDGEYPIDPGFRVRYGIGADMPILLFSSRFLHAKGLLDVIAACGELKTADCDFVLFCLGDGPARDDAENLANALCIAEHIRFTGYVSEKEANVFHANSTIFVFPTYHDEGFPLVILKSLAAGIPIITTRLRGPADSLQEPENCLWTAPNDPQGLAEKIAILLDDDKLRTSMSDNNRRLAKRFSARNVAADYISLYNEIITRHQVK